jgi:hypothetical protein
MESLQGFGSIATILFVVIHAELWQYVCIATKWHSLPAVAIGHMVIGYCHKIGIVAINCAIATTMREVASFFLVATLT